MSAWVTREWTDAGKRKRAKAPPGVRGVKESDRFAVEWLDRKGKRFREKIKEPGRFGKNLADERCREINSQMTLGLYEQRAKDAWADTKERYVRDVLPTLAEASRYEYKRALNLFETIAQPKRMEDITTAAVDRFIAERLKQKTRDDQPIRNTTINKDLRALRKFCRKAMRWKSLREMPDIEMLEETETSKPSFTEAEFEAMYRACETAEPSLPLGIAFPQWLWWQSLLAIYWETGMRRCELLALRWSDVNLDARYLAIAPEHTKTKRLKKYSFGDLAARQLRMLAAYGTEGHVLVWRHDVSRLNEKLNAIKKAAGIAPERQNLAFHAIRRTVGEMTTERYGLTAAQHKLGHTNAAVTAKHYARAALRRLAQQSNMPIPAGLKVVG